MKFVLMGLYCGPLQTLNPLKFWDKLFEILIWIMKKSAPCDMQWYDIKHVLWTPREEIAFTAQPKIPSQSQIFRYNRNMVCCPHWPNFSDIFDLCLHWMSIVRNIKFTSEPWNHYRIFFYNFPKSIVRIDPSINSNFFHFFFFAQWNFIKVF